VGGVIDATRPPEAIVERRYAEIAVECDEVGTTTQAANRWLLVGTTPPHVVDAHGVTRLAHHLRRITHQRPKRSTAARAEAIAASDRILVDVRDRLAIEVIGHQLGPLEGTHKPPLLGVPGREYQRAGRLVAGAQHLTPRTRCLEDADCARDIVDRAVPPGIAMPTDNHDLVGIFTPSDDAERVLDSLERASTALRPRSE